ncbi:MBL fold metallo-hydrolase [candidate division TA06 bacterium]|uniref:MBL fold metallo-hydrolase n=1 Tax=candidate division TA06 bacterium TaxID=2250710 RepID=A0A523UVU0_UNCT6|nr:MAG: MBL fold metallo-hydrolase [candidate division TA06 bacterium]
MKISFLGAAKSVTGSCHRVECNGKTVLLDCGLHQGHRDEADRLNRSFSFEPSRVDFVLVSHAHIDHSGNLPTLAKKGFRGRIIATRATIDLLNVMLKDSAHIQKRDIQYVNKKRKKKGLPPKDILYTLDDVEQALGMMEGVDYGTRVSLGEGVSAEFFDAGHILGSALIRIEDGETTLTFTGDLGRKNMAILRDPYQVQETDSLITESTYGNRLHDRAVETEEKLAEIIRESVRRKGKMIIPAFSVGRTQALVYSLHSLSLEEKIPKLPMFVDSPLSMNVTEIFKRHPECYDEEIREMLHSEGDPFGFGNLKYVSDVEESRALNRVDYPCVIISASGMCEAGRILHHLKNSITDKRNTVLIVGYQAQGTLGRRLVEKEKIVRIFGEKYKRRCRIEVLNGYSAHADKRELGEYIGKMNITKNIFCVHGEENATKEFAESLRKSNNCGVHVPNLGDSFELH